MLEIRETEKGKSVFTTIHINKDDIILTFEQHFLDHPTRTSMQIDEGKHQESNNPEAEENFISHSCTPNGYIDFKDLTLRALEDIEEGKEVTYNYLTTEWEIKEKFKCHCNSPHCIETIKGFKYLEENEKKKLRISPYLRKKYEQS